MATGTLILSGKIRKKHPRLARTLNIVVFVSGAVGATWNIYQLSK